MHQLDRDRPEPLSQLIATIYSLGYCARCKIKYAIVPDPRFPKGAQFYFFDRDVSLMEVTHICSGGFMCLKGHELTITAPEAVYTNTGVWVKISPRQQEHN